jgi:hypothetical protein
MVEDKIVIFLLFLIWLQLGGGKILNEIVDHVDGFALWIGTWFPFSTVVFWTVVVVGYSSYAFGLQIPRNHSRKSNNSLRRWFGDGNAVSSRSTTSAVAQRTCSQHHAGLE